MDKKLTEKLKKLDFVKDQNLFAIGDEPQNPYIYLSLLETKKLFPEVSYVYFRQFPQETRAPLAQAYIFDFSDEIALPKVFGETVKNIWLTGKIPLIYAFTQTEVNIISANKQPDYKDSCFDVENSILDQIELANLANNKIFSAKRLDNGSFWDDQKLSKYFNFKDSPYEILLKKLKDMLNDIVDSESEQELDKVTAKSLYQKLLLRSILIKYLEDRTDENEDKIFKKGFFEKFSNSEDYFISVLSKRGAIIDLFAQLEKDFNGNIFALTEFEKKILKSKDLSSFISVFDDFVDDKKQIRIWKLYSFNFIPIELISNIYEEFMPKTTGVVYTPPFLVDFLIDQSMPLKDLIDRNGYFRVIDPSCGSGVFLVAAFKRLVQAWKIKHKDPKPKIKDLKEILLNCIFGIDLQKESIELAAFSLTIALCDQLSPKNIRELQFKDLTENNLLKQDFFTVILNNDNKYDNFLNSFDLVIGNPPFDSHLTTLDAGKVEQRQKVIRGFKIPDNQISLLFLETVLILCKTNGRTCIIQPAGPSLYNSGSFNFRSYLFKTYNILNIYDLTPLESTLFGIADVATTAFIMENTEPTEQPIFHITIRRTSSAKERMFFELDSYDFHKVSYKDALENRLVWKSNLLGGGRLKFISERLQMLKTFEQFLDKKIENNGWFVGEGFIIGNRKEIEELEKYTSNRFLSDQELKAFNKLKRKYKQADFITSKSHIPTQAFSENGIDNSKIISISQKYFYRISEKNKLIFSPPHLLIKKSITTSSIPIECRDDYLTFKDRIVGIHAKDNQKDELKKIESYIKNNHYLIGFIALLSSTFMVNRATAFGKDDLLSLPYPENPEDLKLSSFEQILIDDVIHYQIDFRSKGEKSKVLFPTESNNLIDFADKFLTVINSVYKEFKAAEPIETNSFICYPFYFGDKPKQDLEEFKNNTEILEKHLESLIKHQPTSTLRINRILRIYDKNIIYLIKPNQLRYWLKSIAIRDADETVADFIEKGF